MKFESVRSLRQNTKRCAYAIGNFVRKALFNHWSVGVLAVIALIAGWLSWLETNSATNYEIISKVSTFCAIFVVAITTHLKTREESRDYKSLLGKITGEGSFPKVSQVIYRGDPRPGNIHKRSEFTIALDGEFPIRNFQIRAINIGNFLNKGSEVYHTNLIHLDLDTPSVYPRFPRTPQAQRHIQPMYSEDLKILKERGIIMNIPTPEFTDEPCLGIDMYCESDFTTWFIKLRYRKVGDEYAWATTTISIKRIGGARDQRWTTLYTYASPDYPREDNGKIRWYDNKIS